MHQRLQQLQQYRRLLERSLALHTHELQRLDDSLQGLRQELLRLHEHRQKLGHHQRLLLQQLYRSHTFDPADALTARLRHYVYVLLTHSLRQSQQLQQQHDTIAQLRDRLQALQHQRLQWLQRREHQRRELEHTIQQQKRLLTALRSRRQALERLLRERQRDAQRLQRTLERLAAAARQHKQKMPEPVTPSPAPTVATLAPTPRLPAHGSAGHTLQWPSASRRLLRGYGAQRNAETGIVWTNPGIDIAASRGSPVQAVAPGIVKLIQWLPTYQSVIVVEHANNLRSVYANLERVTLHPGAVVDAGTILGTSGSTPDGEGFHFQLWRGRQHLNPLEWLR